jgi:hypothetical protein
MIERISGNTKSLTARHFSALVALLLSAFATAATTWWDPNIIYHGAAAIRSMLQGPRLYTENHEPRPMTREEEFTNFDKIDRENFYIDNITLSRLIEES